VARVLAGLARAGAAALSRSRAAAHHALPSGGATSGGGVVSCTVTVNRPRATLPLTRLSRVMRPGQRRRVVHISPCGTK